MDAVKFVETIQRKIKNENRDEIIIRVTDDSNLFVDLVEEWSKEHPLKTRQSVFLEQYPDVELTKDGVISICPMAVSAAYRNKTGGCSSPTRPKCVDCRREFWMKEVDE